MNELQDMLDMFRNDKGWNTEYRDGTHRFDKEIAWIESMVKSYAECLGLTPDEVASRMEKERNYSWPNYYQPINFPPINSDDIYGVFQTFDEFADYAHANWEGFRCPRCGTVSKHPMLCQHRLEKDGVCDWCSDGFISTGKGIFVLEHRLKMIPIFEPVPKVDHPGE